MNCHCVCDTSVCFCVKSEKKKKRSPTQIEDTHRSVKPRPNHCYKFDKKKIISKSEHLSSFLASLCAAQEQTSPAKPRCTNNNNEAVNKDDVSTSLCFQASKQNGSLTPFRGKQHEREQVKRPGCFSLNSFQGGFEKGRVILL